jgi:hypothetical protein
MAKGIRLTNFTGIVRKKANGQVVVDGRGRARKTEVSRNPGSGYVVWPSGFATSSLAAANKAAKADSASGERSYVERVTDQKTMSRWHYGRRVGSARKNVQMGFWRAGKFHPIRASSDYDPEREGEALDVRKKKKKKPKAKAKAKKAKTKKRR